MPKLTIIFPILNEEKTLPSLLSLISHYPPGCQFLFCDGGSTDKSRQIIDSHHFVHDKKVLSDDLVEPSILKTIKIGLKAIDTDFVLIHPVDANCSKVLEDIQKRLHPKLEYIIFYKQYTSREWHLNIQEFLLNRIRVSFFKSFVWTNCPLVRRDLLFKVQSLDKGFLEDVLISDYFKKNYQSTIVKNKVIVSDRRYKKDGHLKRFLGNLLIMLCFRLNLKSIDELKKYYY